MTSDMVQRYPEIHLDNRLKEGCHTLSKDIQIYNLIIMLRKVVRYGPRIYKGTLY